MLEVRLEAQEGGGDVEGEGEGEGEGESDEDVVVVDGCKQRETDPHAYPPDAFRYGSK